MLISWHTLKQVVTRASTVGRIRNLLTRLDGRRYRYYSNDNRRLYCLNVHQRRGPFYSWLSPFYFWLGPFYFWLGPFYFWLILLIWSVILLAWSVLLLAWSVLLLGWSVLLLAWSVLLLAWSVLLLAWSVLLLAWSFLLLASSCRRDWGALSTEESRNLRTPGKCPTMWRIRCGGRCTSKLRTSHGFDMSTNGTFGSHRKFPRSST